MTDTPAVPTTPEVIDYLDREGVLTFADEGHRQRVIDGLPARSTPAEALDVPDMNVLCAILDDVPPRIVDTLAMDGEGLAAWIVGHWSEYARLASKQVVK